MKIDYKMENAILYVCIACLVLGLYYMSGSWHSLCGLLLGLLVNSPTKQ